MSQDSIEHRARGIESLAAAHERLAVRHALIGHDRVAAVHAEFAVIDRAEARELRATMHTKYTGEDLYAAVTA